MLRLYSQIHFKADSPWYIIEFESNAFLILFIALLLLLLVFTIVKPLVHTRKENERKIQEMEQRIANRENELPFAEIHATVLQKRADIDQSGKYHREVYAAEFLTDDGERLTLEITEEAFQKIEPQQSGLLITLQGKFYDFGDGSDI